MSCSHDINVSDGCLNDEQLKSNKLSMKAKHIYLLSLMTKVTGVKG